MLASYICYAQGMKGVIIVNDGEMGCELISTCRENKAVSTSVTVDGEVVHCPTK